MSISFVGSTSSATAAGATSTTVTPSIPAGVAASDVLILALADGADPATLTGPAGWTQVDSVIDTGTAPAEARMTVWWKVATGSDTAPTVTAGSSTRWVAMLMAYRGVDNVTPFIDHSGQAESGGSSTTVHTAPTITNTDAGAWGLYALASRQVATPYSATPGTGLTERIDQEVGNAGTTNTLGYWADSNGTVATGSVTYSATGSAGSAFAAIWAGLLKPSTAGSDTTAPSVPTGVTAVGTSAYKVTVSWTASTDNVGVAAYRVQRGGVDLASVTVGTSYVDTSVDAGTTYSYTVSASDAVGNRSAESSTASATTPAAPSPGGSVTHVGTSGAFSANSATSLVQVNPAGVQSGDLLLTKVHSSFSSNTISTPTGWTLVTGPIEDGQTGDGQHYLFRRFANGSATDTPTWTPSGSTSMAYEVVVLRNADPTNPINAVNSVVGLGSTTAVTQTTTVPNCLVINFVGDRKNSPDGVTPRYTAVDTTNWIEDRDIGEGSGSPSLSAHNSLRLQATAGTVPSQTWTQSSGTNGYAVIQVAVSPIQSDSIPPSVPTNVTATANGPTSVTITWTASTDNAAVSSYQVKRNGTVIAGSVSGTTYTDNTASASTTYNYTVNAADAAGNRSGDSAVASLTTPSGGASAITKVGTNGAFGADGSSSVTQVNPAGATTGDFLVVQVHTSKTSGSVSTPSGWTLQIGPVADAQAGDGSHYVFTRFMDGTAADTPTWTSSASPDVVAYLAVALRGASTATPINAVGSVAGTGTPTFGIAMTTTIANCYVINFIGDRKGVPDSTPRFTPVDSTNWSADMALGVSPGPTASLSLRDTVRVQSAAGAVPAQTYTQSSSTNGYVITQIAVQPPFIDTVAPTVPSGVTATALGGGSVRISWTPSTDDVGVASYRIRRGGTDLTGATAVAGTTFTDTTVSPSTAYSYTVSAVDASGNRSAESTAATATTTAGTVVSRWVGGVSTTTATVAVKIAGAASVRLKVGTDTSLTSGAIFSLPVTPDANGMCKTIVTGLTPNTQYFYALELDNVLYSGVIDRFKTFPSGASNFTFAFGSCFNPAVDPNDEVFGRILARNPLLFVHLGDLRYKNIGSNNQTLFRNMYDEVLSSTNESVLYANLATAYTWSDHDYGPSNSDGTSPAKPAAQAVYRQYAPSYSLPATDGGIYQTWVVGRVRFIMTDNRSYKSVDSVTDDASKTMLGATQKQWFKDTLTAATEPLIVWAQENLWTNPVEVGGDNWGGFDTERQELATFIAASGKNIVTISGDTHELAADDGTSGAAGIPQLLSSPFSQSAAHKGGPWSQGTYPASGSAVVHQYSTVDIVDTGGTIAFTFKGYDSTDTVQVSLTKSYTVAPSTGSGSTALLVGGIASAAAYLGSIPVSKIYAGEIQVYPVGTVSASPQDLTGGDPTTTSTNFVADGGRPGTTVFDFTFDGGTP